MSKRFPPIRSKADNVRASILGRSIIAKLKSSSKTVQIIAGRHCELLQRHNPLSSAASWPANAGGQQIKSDDAMKSSTFKLKTVFSSISSRKLSARHLRLAVFMHGNREPNLFICKLIIKILDYSQSIRLFLHRNQESGAASIPCDRILINKLFMLRNSNFRSTNDHLNFKF